MKNISTQLKAFIVETFMYENEGVVLTDDFLLFEERVIDSMGIFRLVTFINETFAVSVPPTEIVLENFGTVGDMTRLIEQLLQGEAAEPNEFRAFT